MRARDGEGRGARRRLFSFCSALSLLLCVAVCTLWVRSHLRGDDLQHSLNGETDLRFWTRPGSVFVTIGSIRDEFVPEDGWKHRSSPPDREGSRAFAFERTRVSTGYASAEYLTVGVRLWLPASFFSILPAGVVYRQMQFRRNQRYGKCPVCGYDLRATPDRCPECGAPRTIA